MTDDPVPPPSGSRDQLREEAAMWFARMRGEDAAQHRHAFDLWLARGALHRAAYNRIGEVFAAGKILKSDTHHRDHDARRGRRLGSIGLLLATVMVLLIVGFQHLDFGRRPLPRASTSSPAPELAGYTMPRTVPLPGGGNAVLDVDALVATELAGRPDVSRLERGRARFAMLRTSAPQKILVGNHQAISSGGTFDLWLRSDGSLDARVISGDLEIRPAVMTRSGSVVAHLVRLAAGQHYRADPSGRQIAFVGEPGLDWPHGILEFRQTPLAEVVQEANRYSAVKIVLADPSLAGRRVSGRFRVDDPVRLARQLAIALSLELAADQPGILLLRSPKKSSHLP